MFKYFLLTAGISLVGMVVIFLIMSAFTEWDDIDRDKNNRDAF